LLWGIRANGWDVDTWRCAYKLVCPEAGIGVTWDERGGSGDGEISHPLSRVENPDHSGVIDLPHPIRVTIVHRRGAGVAAWLEVCDDDTT